MKKLLILILFLFVFSFQSFGKTVRYKLTVRNEKTNMSGKKEVDFALTVNGTIPAPTLEFTEGDDAEILVQNEILNEEVSIHWHGILLPPEEDGVAYVNTPPIYPGTSRLFKFKIRQNGTYWYHSHTTVQEQKGVYGGIIIHPKQKKMSYDKEAVVVLSDWSDEDANQIMRNLRKDGDYYLYKKDSIRSYTGALYSGGLKSLKNYLYNEWTRMGGMDLSDVGYDAFLINGKQESQLLKAQYGEKIRLRIINAAASSYFYLSLAGQPMTVISADGVDIEPMRTKELLIGMAETYDILFEIPDNKNYELRATAQDTTGFATAWIGHGEKILAPIKTPPDMYSTMDHHSHTTENHSEHIHKKDDSIPHKNSNQNQNQNSPQIHSNLHSDHKDHEVLVKHETNLNSKLKTHHHQSNEKNHPLDWSNQSHAILIQNSTPQNFNPLIPIPLVDSLTVDSLKANAPTSLPKNTKVHELKLILGGDMERYIWHINGKAIYEDRLLTINKGEVVRFIFSNETMMHHPMHLHGHFFRVINKHGEFSPLKHTVDVPPHQTRTIEFFANEPGQWMLHCHNLYHMKTGMARVIRYNDFKLSPEIEKNDQQDPHRHNHLYTYSLIEAASNHAQGLFKMKWTWDELNFRLESTSTNRKNFSLSDDWLTQGDLVYRRWTSNWFNVFSGGTFHGSSQHAIIGIGYILPLLIESSLSINHEGQIRLDIEKRFQWTKSISSNTHFSWSLGLDGEKDQEFEMNLMYSPSWTWSAGLILTEKNLGAGVQVQF